LNDAGLTGGRRPEPFYRPSTLLQPIELIVDETEGVHRQKENHEMKKCIAALATGAVVLSAGGICWAASGVPEVDKASATITVKPSSPFVRAACTGEDGSSYVTFHGSWAGGEADATPGSTDYGLSGSFSVSGIVWTINLKTGRGVLHGTAKLAGPAGTIYLGPITLITDSPPAARASGMIARGWINAATYTKGVADGGSLLANVEFHIDPSFAAMGEFGSSYGLPDISAATNNRAC
jgi:hypothetical protein